MVLVDRDNQVAHIETGSSGVLLVQNGKDG